MTSSNPNPNAASEAQDDEELAPEAAAMAARIKRLTALSMLTLFVGIFAVFGAILYRSFQVPSSGDYEPKVFEQSLSQQEDVVGMQAVEGKLYVLIRTAQGFRIVETDPAQWSDVFEAGPSIP
jgi:hypothetical protein